MLICNNNKSLMFIQELITGDVYLKHCKTDTYVVCLFILISQIVYFIITIDFNNNNKLSSLLKTQ